MSHGGGGLDPAVQEHGADQGLDGVLEDPAVVLVGAPAAAAEVRLEALVPGGVAEADVAAWGEYFHADGAPLGRLVHTVGHETGHAVFDYASDGGAYGGFPAYTNDFEEDDCPADGSTQHWFNSKEYQSGAVAEGWATYHAVVPDSDYYSDYCAGSGTQLGRANEYDYVRFFWDLDSKGDPASGVDFTWGDMLQLVDGVDAQTWSKSGDLGPTDPDSPYYRLEAAAAAIGPEASAAFAHWAAEHGIAR